MIFSSPRGGPARDADKRVADTGFALQEHRAGRICACRRITSTISTVDAPGTSQALRAG